MKTTITCVVALAAVVFANPLVIARKEQGSDFGQKCTSDAQCALPNGKCSMPLSGGTTPLDIARDTIIKIGHPYCDADTGCDCLLQNKHDVVKFCKLYNAEVVGPNLVIVDGCVPANSTEVQCDGYVKKYDPKNPDIGVGPEAAGHFCKDNGI